MFNTKQKIATLSPTEIHRSERVTWLLGGVIVLSLIDLILTISYLTSVGMSEGNPIAAWLVTETNSIWPLALYKAITVSICVTLLYRTRYRSQSEVASWCAMLILVALSVWWNQYSRYQPYLPVSESHLMLVGDTFEQPFNITKRRQSLVQ